jgi:hypothetical protein
MTNDDTYGIEVTPDMIQELLSEGQILIAESDRADIYLYYDTTPRVHSEGFNE